MRKFCDCFENFIQSLARLCWIHKIMAPSKFKPSLWSTSSFKNNISMVLQWPLFEVAQYVLEILRSILATGGRYEHRCYSVQGSTYNICVSSTCLFHHAWYCLLCPKSLVPSIPTYDALPVDYTVMTNGNDYGGCCTENLRDQLHLISFIVANETGDATDARQMLSYYLIVYLQINWNLSLLWTFIQARWEYNNLGILFKHWSTILRTTGQRLYF